jgi:hypothetical protein
MAVNTTISNAGAIAMLNALVDLLDAGAGAATIKIYTGSQPANPDVAIGAQTLLATLTCSDPAFGNAADANPGAIATASAITADASADNTGTAAWFRAADSNGVAIIDGTVGTASADMILNTVSIVTAAEVACTSWTVTMPES